MSTDSSTLQSLKLFGYTETEAGFLRLVALHSGVFLARQFNQFAQIKSGKRVDSFTNKLKSNRHCQTYRLAKNTSVFHVSSKAIYRAIGHENLRHRRSHQVDYVKTKLLTLDYVLQNPTLKYFPTEDDKLHLFTQVLNIPLSELPAKAYRTPYSKMETLRYFVDKYPLFLSDVSPIGPVVHFSYVDPGPYTTVVEFLNHLRRYALLLARMPVIRMVYIYQVSSKLKQARDLFQAFVRSGCRLGAGDLELVKYFQLREAWESKQFEKVGSIELQFLNHARKKYAAARYEELYWEWKSGDRTKPVQVFNGHNKVSDASFTTYKIGEPYAPFGDLD
jgi:hypothetical protein